LLKEKAGWRPVSDLYKSNVKITLVPVLLFKESIVLICNVFEVGGMA
jgi:hypothetical protein